MYQYSGGNDNTNATCIIMTTFYDALTITACSQNYNECRFKHITQTSKTYVDACCMSAVWYHFVMFASLFTLRWFSMNGTGRIYPHFVLSTRPSNSQVKPLRASQIRYKQLFLHQLWKHNQSILSIVYLGVILFQLLECIVFVIIFLNCLLYSIYMLEDTILLYYNKVLRAWHHKWIASKVDHVASTRLCLQM